MICYNTDKDTIQELINRKYKILAFAEDGNGGVKYDKPNFSIVVERFLHMWLLLKQFRGQYRYIVTTDVKDVIFQTDPMKWLEQNLGDKKINVASESIRYRDEDWGKNNLLKAFGQAVYEENKDNVIVNAGTVSGDFDTMLDFFFNVYMLCSGIPHFTEGGGGPDQAAVNILVNMSPYKNITNVANSEDGYAAQLGTTGPQIVNKYKEKLVELEPLFKDSGVVVTNGGTTFAMVHQYDRVPEWKEKIEELYS